MDKILRCINNFISSISSINLARKHGSHQARLQAGGFPRIIINCDALIGWSDRVIGSAEFRSVAESLLWFSVTSFRGVHTRRAHPTVPLLAVDSGGFSASCNHYIWYICTHMTRAFSPYAFTNTHTHARTHARTHAARTRARAHTHTK